MDLSRYLLMIDRDGCLNEKAPGSQYVTSLDFLKLNQEAIIFLRDMRSTGLNVAVITNQQGIAKQLYSEEVVVEIHHQIEEESGYPRNSIALYVCPHLEGTCACRKPQPLLLEKAINNSGTKKENSWFLGDSPSDAEAANNAGVRFFAYRFIPNQLGISVSPVRNFAQVKEEIIRVACNQSTVES